MPAVMIIIHEIYIFVQFAVGTDCTHTHNKIAAKLSCKICKLWSLVYIIGTFFPKFHNGTFIENFGTEE